MFWNKSDVKRPGALRSSKLRLENLEERQLLTAVGVIDVPYGPEPAPVVCVASIEVDEAPAINLTEGASSAESVSVLATTENTDPLCVDPDAEDGAENSLRWAITNAAPGATITFQHGGTIVLDGDQGQLTIEKSLTIDASDFYDWKTGTPGVTINAGWHCRVFGIGDYEDSIKNLEVEINGLKITGGDVSDLGNSAGYGGGVFVCSSGGTFTAKNVEISGNTAYCFGGGICLVYSAFNATNVKISRNTLTSEHGVGGGISVFNSTFTATNVEISENTATNGGGVFLSNSAFTATNVEISRNIANGESCGGGVYVYNSTFTATNVEISENIVSGITTDVLHTGGGVYVSSNAIFNATNVSIAGNSVTAAWSAGGGIYLEATSKCELYNSIVACNYAASDTNIPANRYTPYNTYVGENSEDDPGFRVAPELNSSTKTYEIGDLHLKSDSEMVDAGSNEYVNGTNALVEIDLDGNYRICQGKFVSTDTTVDRGAYEYQPETHYEQTISATTTDDVVNPFDGQISLREAIQYAADGDTINLTETTYNVASAITLDKSIALNGNNATLDGDNLTQIFEVASGKTVTASYMTLTQGNADYGGAIKNNGTLTLNAVNLNGNAATKNGGAIANYGGLTLTNVTATGNAATKNGGVVFNDENATLTIDGGTFGQEDGANSARNGGAFANYGTMYISGANTTTISYNTATLFGGAYFGCKTLNITGAAEFTDNSVTYAGSKGGAIYNDDNGDLKGEVSITGSVGFTGNRAVERGGAIMSYSTLDVGGTTTFTGNNGGEYGGAIDVGQGGVATLSGDLTFGGTEVSDGNTANFGGAIFTVGTTSFDSNGAYTFTGNMASTGGAIDACDGTLNLAGTFTCKSNKAVGEYDANKSGLGGVIATAASTTVAEGTTFNWGVDSEANSASAFGHCVAIDTTKSKLGADVFNLESAPVAKSYSSFTVLDVVTPSSAAPMVPQMFAANAVAATITLGGVATTFGEEGVTPEALGLGAGTHDALIQYTDANGETSALYTLVLTVDEGASIDVRETTIANGRGVKFDFNLTKADGRAVSVWEISWGDGTTTRSDNLSSSWMAAHYYAQDGTFDVALKVTYLDGASETFEAFATRTVGTPLTTSALDAAFADVDELFVELESPLVYGPTLSR